MASVVRKGVYTSMPCTTHRVLLAPRNDHSDSVMDEDSTNRAVDFRVYGNNLARRSMELPPEIFSDYSDASSSSDEDSPSREVVREYDAEDDDAEEEKYKLETVSRNFVDFHALRQTGPGRLESYHVEREYATRYLLTNNMLSERVIRLDPLDKIFSAEWMSDRQVVFGTKCNKVMVYNVVQRKTEQIPSLSRPVMSVIDSTVGIRSRKRRRAFASSLANTSEVKGGIHAVRINKSGTLLATGGKQSCDVAVYALPTFDPVFVGAGAHEDLIFDITWIDDQLFVSGSRDSTLALWKVSSKDVKFESDVGPRCALRAPVKKEKCKMGDKVRTMGFNPKYPEIVAVSMNAYVHVFDPLTLTQKYSRKLPHLVENVCVAVDEQKDLYAIGSKSHTTLLDARTLTPTEKVGSRIHGCGIRSLSFMGNILTMGTGMGQVQFYDLRAKKFLESAVHTGRFVALKMSNGTVLSDDGSDLHIAIDPVPAIYTHCYDHSGTRLFTAGGPLQVGIQGNYASIWQ